MTIAITRLDLSAADLRDAARRTRDAKAARRMIAIALVLEGWSRDAAAEAGAMDRQTLCDWVHRYNELGAVGPVRPAASQWPAATPVSRTASHGGGMGGAGSGIRAGWRGTLALCRSAAPNCAGVCGATA